MLARYFSMSHCKKILRCLYTSSMDSAKQRKSYCYYEIKTQMYNVFYNVKKNLWVINALSMEELQMRCLHKTYRFEVRTSFQLMYLPNACETYGRNIYIPSNNRTNKLTCINITVLTHAFTKM